MHYLKEYRRGTYINLLTSGRLNTHLAEIDKQAHERFERLTESMKQAQGTEQLKEETVVKEIVSGFFFVVVYEIFVVYLLGFVLYDVII